MDFNGKLELVLFLIVISVCVISADDTPYTCYQNPGAQQITPKCTMLNVNLDTKVDFYIRFTLKPEYPRINELHFINSSIAYIPRSLFAALPYLNRLNMIGCDLIEISPYDFVNAVNLQFVELSRNALTELKYLAFSGAGSLIEINLAHNEIGRIEKDAFNNLQYLRKLDLSNNHIAIITEDTFRTLNLKELNLNANQITAIDDQAFRSLPVAQLKLDFNEITKISINYLSIESVSLNNNAIVELRMTGDTNLKSLHADNNRIQNELLTVANNQNRLNSLSLANNSLSSINFIKIFSGLLYVDLSFNPLSGDSIESDTFLWLPSLGSLYLAATNLHHLDFKSFSSVKNLRVLDVSHNDLRILKFYGIKSLSYLKQLYINGNSLNQLAASELEDLFGHLDILDITDNDLQCHNMMEIFEKLKQIKRKNSFNGNFKNLAIHGVTCQNRDLDSGVQNNSNYYYMELEKVRFEMSTLKKQTEYLIFQLASVMASQNATVNGVNEYLMQLTSQISVLNATYRDDMDEINSKIMTGSKLNLGNLLGADNYNRTTIKNDDGKIVNILIV